MWNRKKERKKKCKKRKREKREQLWKLEHYFDIKKEIITALELNTLKLPYTGRQMTKAKSSNAHLTSKPECHDDESENIGNPVSECSKTTVLDNKATISEVFFLTSLVQFFERFNKFVSHPNHDSTIGSIWNSYSSKVRHLVANMFASFFNSFVCCCAL